MFYYIDEERLKIIAVKEANDWDKKQFFKTIEEASFSFHRFLRKSKIENETKLSNLVWEERKLRQRIQDQGDLLKEKDKVYSICKDCGGEGEWHGHKTETCYACKGTGTILVEAANKI